MLAIAYPEAAPYAVSDVVSLDGQPEVHIVFYGAHPAATWISHNPQLAIIRQLLIEQPSAGVVRLRVLLNRPVLWGYRTEIVDGSFRVYIRNAPEYDMASPLKGLKVAIEAGHGGSDNGARGMAGTREKDVNRLVSDVLEKQLLAAGASVVQTRRRGYQSWASRAGLPRHCRECRLFHIHPLQFCGSPPWLPGGKRQLYAL